MVDMVFDFSDDLFMRKLVLSNGGNTLVDDSVYTWASLVTWWKVKREKRWYVMGHGRKSSGEFTKIYLHREILGAKPGEYVDHRTGNGLNNLRSNLRLCTNQQNAAAFRAPVAGKTSRFRGVHWSSERNQWVGSIRVNYRKIFLGRFNDETEAATAYDRAAQEHFGVFAQLNLKGRYAGKN